MPDDFRRRFRFRLALSTAAEYDGCPPEDAPDLTPAQRTIAEAMERGRRAREAAALEQRRAAGREPATQ
jgi:hypothetical protein